MARFVMEVFHYVDAASDKLWAVCSDGPRVITHWGRRDTAKLMGGGPVKLDGPMPLDRIKAEGKAFEAAKKLKSEKLAKGYKSLGTYSVTDGVIDWNSAGAAKQAGSNPAVGATHAYAEIALDEGWKRKVAEMFNAMADFTLEDEEELRILYQGSHCLRIPQSKRGRALVQAKAGDPAVSFVCLLAVARCFGAECYDREGNARDGCWLYEAPELFGNNDPGIKVIAEELGIIAKSLRLKKEKSAPGLFG